MRRLALLATMLAACGGGTHSGATFSGTVHGQAFAPADAQSAPATVTFSVGTAGVGAIVMSDAPAVCARLAANTEPKNGKVLVILLTDVNLASFTGSPPGAPGTYTVYDFSGSGLPPQHVAYVSFGVNDANCVQVDAQSATGKSGTVTLTRAASGAYAGSFDVTFDSGDHVTGTFAAAACPALTTYLGTSTHSCG